MNVKNKIKGQAGSTGLLVSGIVTTIIGIILSLQLFGNTSSDVVSALDNASGSGLPLASLFSSTGIVALIYVAGFIQLILGLVFRRQ